MALKLGEFVAVLGIDTGGYTGGILSAQGVTEVFGQTFVNAVTNPVLFGIEVLKKFSAAVGNEIAKAAAEAEKLKTLERVTGLDPELVQTITRSIAEAGGETGNFNAVMTKVADSLANAKAGSEEAIKGFEKLGVTASDIAGIEDQTELVLAIADGLSRIPDLQKRISASKDVFGIGASPELIDTLSLGRAGLLQLRDELIRTNVIRARVQVDGFAEVDAAFDRLERRWDAFWNQAGASATRAIAPIAQQVNLINEEQRKAIDAIGPQNGPGSFTSNLTGNPLADLIIKLGISANSNSDQNVARIPPNITK